MKTFAMALGLVAFLSLASGAADDKIDLAGKYKLVAGKKNGNDIDEVSKKSEFTFTADKITIKGGDMTFVIGYKLDPKAKPVAIELEILEGPDGAKGTKAVGIIEVKGETLKLAYSLDKEKRPKDFDGKEDFLMELKKEKAK